MFSGIPLIARVCASQYVLPPISAPICNHPIFLFEPMRYQIIYSLISYMGFVITFLVSPQHLITKDSTNNHIVCGILRDAFFHVSCELICLIVFSDIAEALSSCSPKTVPVFPSAHQSKPLTEMSWRFSDEACEACDYPLLFSYSS